MNEAVVRYESRATGAALSAAAESTVHVQPKVEDAVYMSSEVARPTSIAVALPVVSPVALPANVVREEQHQQSPTAVEMHPRWKRVITAAPERTPVQSSEVPSTVQQQPQAPRRAVAELTLQRLYHLRMGHVAMSNLQRMVKEVSLSGFPKQLEVSFADSSRGSLLPAPVCAGCALGKAHRAAFGHERAAEALATEPLQRVWADLAGPVRIGTQDTQQQEVRASLDGGEALYLSIIVDEATRRVWGALLNTKSAAAAHVQQWLLRAEKQSGRSVKEFHSDGGKEYLSLKEFFRALCAPLGGSPSHSAAQRDRRTNDANTVRDGSSDAATRSTAAGLLGGSDVDCDLSTKSLSHQRCTRWTHA